MSNNLDQAIDNMMSNKNNSDADGNKDSDEATSDKKEETGEQNRSDVSESSDAETLEGVDEIEQWLQRLVMGGSSGSKAKYEPSREEYDEMLSWIADYIKSESCQNVITMAGAGISTSAGIPDFRSPKTGLYATLADKYPELSQPEDIFNIAFFKNNPTPFFKLAKELMMPSGKEGGFEPTPSHYFIKHLSDKGKLLRHYTQNIDGLGRKAGVPEDKLIEAHGSFGKAHCLSRGCNKEYSEEWMREMIAKDAVPTRCKKCKALVKPDIVFFGENLPEKFHTSINKDFKKCDMLIVMGTSLQVQPFASLVNMVNRDCPVLLINMENSAKWMFHLPLPKKDFHGSNRKVFWKGDCDTGCTKLESLMGWNATETKTSSEEKSHSGSS